MGYEMSKPHLRAELEADLKAICDGGKTKDDVLSIQICKYREVFVEAVRQANKIDSALAEYFGDAQAYQAPEINGSSIPVCRCQKCGSDMVVKSKKDGRSFFLSCTGFPECRNTVWFPDGVIGAEVSNTVCNSCKPEPVHWINFKFRPGTVPPGIPLEHEGCVGGCDENLLNALNIQPLTRRGGDTTIRGAFSAQPDDSGYSSGLSTQGRSIASQGRTFTLPPQLSNARSSGMVRQTTSQSGFPSNSFPSSNINDRSKKSGSKTKSSARLPLAAIPDNNAVVCACGNNAAHRTVFKEGPNQGRKFYACARLNGQQCDFFMWDDSDHADNSTVASQQTSRQFSTPENSRNSGRQSQSFSSATPGDVVCKCQIPAVKLTVQKDGVNKGRQFFTCSKQRNSQCGFFQWADEASLPANSSFAQSGHSSGFNSAISLNLTSEEPGAVQCKCGIAASQRTVQKDGPNKGRKFYTCSKPREDQCGFFEWMDQTEASAASAGFGQQNSFHRQGGGERPLPRKNPGTRKPRKCGLCGQEGHTRKTCPRKNAANF